MRQEVENWWKQAQADFDSAKDLIKTKHYYFASFACQQAIEKGLKALYLKDKKTLPIGHSIVYLAKEMGVPADIFNSALRLNMQYTTTRYPDAANAAPVDVYNEEISTEHFVHTKKVLEWLTKQIQK